MKKKILLVVTIAAFAVTGAMTISSARKAQAGIDPECPNGCLLEKGKGCYCYQWYPYVKEAVWPE